MLISGANGGWRVSPLTLPSIRESCHALNSRSFSGIYTEQQRPQWSQWGAHMSTMVYELSSTPSCWRRQKNSNPCSQPGSSRQVLPGSAPVLASLAKHFQKLAIVDLLFRQWLAGHLSPLWSLRQQSHAQLWIWFPLRGWSCWPPSC